MAQEMATVSREHQVIQRCVESIMKDAGTEAKALKAKYNKRGWGSNVRMRPVDLYYLRVEEIRQKAKERMRRLRISDELIDIYMEKNFKVMRKNSRGKDGVRHAR